MAYDATKPYSYGIENGTYKGKPTTGTFYEKDGRLILDVSFMAWNEAEGRWYQKANGYPWEARKRHWITSADGAFNEATIDGIKEWAKGWTPNGLEDFFWFTDAANLDAIGDVELNFATGKNGGQELWVHDPNRARKGGGRGFVPEGALTDKAAITAKWGAKARAVFAAKPKAIGNRPQAAGNRPQAGDFHDAGAAGRPNGGTGGGDPRTPHGPSGAGWGGNAPAAIAKPLTAEEVWAKFCATRGEPYQSAKHDAAWFDLTDPAKHGGRDVDQYTQEDWQQICREMGA